MCLSAAAERRQPAGRIDGIDALNHLVGTERAIFIIPSVACPVRSGDIELDQMDVLAKYVSRSSDLEIVQLVFVGHEVRVVVGDAVVGVGAEEERLWRAGSVKGRRDVAPEGEDALLREVPADLIQLDVKLDGRGFINARDSRGASAIVHTRVSIRRAGYCRPAVGEEGGGLTTRCETRAGADCVERHGGLLDRRSGFGYGSRVRRQQVLVEIQPGLDM